jgi:hypothetical protein
METFASVPEETDKDFVPYESSSKISSPDTLEPETKEGGPDFFKRSNAEYYTAA